MSTITIKPYSTEKPIIDGNITINGSYVIFRDLEFSHGGWTTRETAEIGSNPLDLPNVNLNVYAPNSKFINCIIRDLRSPGFWQIATNAEFYGCLLYHHGWSAPDRGHGHGLYVQNTTGIKTVKDCIIFNNFGWGLHAYSESNQIDNIVLDGLTVFNPGILHGTQYTNILFAGSKANNITVQNCMTYGAGADHGISIGNPNGADVVSLLNNYCPDGKTLTSVTNLTETGNYYGPDIGNQQFLRANDYDTELANLTIYNEAQSNLLTKDVSAIYKPGDTIRIINVQDYFVDFYEDVVTQSGEIGIDMQAVNRTVATPIGWTPPATTFPAFGCFRLVRQ